MGKKPEKFEKTIKYLANELRECQYSIRGTASLVLQGLNMNVQDVDVLCDKKSVPKVNKLLEKFVQNKIKYSESEKFKSFWGKFIINNIEVEFMGEWQIKDTKGNWSEPYNGKNYNVVVVDGVDVLVTKVEEELSVFAKMGRWNAFHKIKKEYEKIKHPSKEESAQKICFDVKPI